MHPAFICKMDLADRAKLYRRYGRGFVVMAIGSGSRLGILRTDGTVAATSLEGHVFEGYKQATSHGLKYLENAPPHVDGISLIPIGHYARRRMLLRVGAWYYVNESIKGVSFRMLAHLYEQRGAGFLVQIRAGNSIEGYLEPDGTALIADVSMAHVFTKPTGIPLGDDPTWDLVQTYLEDAPVTVTGAYKIPVGKIEPAQYMGRDRLLP